jgi:hypothetical protein
MIRTWWRQATQSKSPSSRGNRRTASRRQQSFRPCLDRLEDRLAPASHTWSGGAGILNPNWSSPANWSVGGAPQANENNVVLTFPAVVNHASRNDVAGLLIDQVSFQAGGYTLSGNRLTLNPAASVTANAGANTIDADIQLSSTGTNTFSVATGPS